MAEAGVAEAEAAGATRSARSGVEKGERIEGARQASVEVAGEQASPQEDEAADGTSDDGSAAGAPTGRVASGVPSGPPPRPSTRRAEHMPSRAAHASSAASRRTESEGTRWSAARSWVDIVASWPLCVWICRSSVMRACFSASIAPWWAATSARRSRSERASEPSSSHTRSRSAAASASAVTRIAASRCRADCRCAARRCCGAWVDAAPHAARGGGSWLRGGVSWRCGVRAAAACPPTASLAASSSATSSSSTASSSASSAASTAASAALLSAARRSRSARALRGGEPLVGACACASSSSTSGGGGRTMCEGVRCEAVGCTRSAADEEGSGGPKPPAATPSWAPEAPPRGMPHASSRAYGTSRGAA